LLKKLSGLLPSDLITGSSPGIGGLLSVDTSLLGSEFIVGPVHGVFVLGGDGNWITIIVWDLFDEVDAGDGSNEEEFEHFFFYILISTIIV